MQSLSNVIVSLQGIVSEPVRCLIARRFAATIHNAIEDEDAKKRFLDVGLPHFLQACEVQDGDPYVPDDLDVEATELARFCDRWMSVQAFREPGVEEWTPITPDMNALRSTMVAELQALAEGVTVTELNDV
ncbi:MAG: hypothetical protein ACYSUB_01755 [Planctomycetota bacterium]|jgi:hypothetical protein